MPDSESHLHVEVVRQGPKRRLRVSTADANCLEGFEGTGHNEGALTVLEGPLSATNAAMARERIPWLRPHPVGLNTSFGVGDRLGLATPGHVRAFREHGHGLRPVYAQQSAREMTRLTRSAQSVMDDATFGVIEAHWTQGFGADADHLKTNEDIDEGLSAGFTTFTLDPGDFVRPVTSQAAVQSSDIPWAALEDTEAAVATRYRSLKIQADDVLINMGGEQATRAAYKYGPAVAHAWGMFRHLQDRASYPIEVEIAVDETAEPTTPEEHVYLATEMRRLGMDWVGLALRHVGSFEKGIEYVGNVDRLVASVKQHSAIASALGPYKLSLHSASDKFSLYAPVLQATQGALHVKTSGTSYLEALRVACECAPDLFREIYRASQISYRVARASYQVSAEQEGATASQNLSDSDLALLLQDPSTRQVLHVGYGELIVPRQRRPDHLLLDELRAVLLGEPERYASLLEAHIGRHLQPLRNLT